MEEFTIRPVEYVGGKHVDVEPRSGLELINFPLPLGPAYAHYTIHSEPATMPAAWRDKGLKNVYFKLALPQDFHDKVAFLADIGFASQTEIEVKEGIKLKPADMLDAVIRNMPKDAAAEVKDCDILRAEVIGTKDGKVVKYTVDSIARQNERLKCSSTELNTGAPPSIVAQMIVRGDVTERGAFGAERGVDPEIFFKELAKRDMYVYVNQEYPVSIDSFEPINAQKEV
jgi:saccharopine dehydrogenase-like NADP-dependent oxidoreductase